MAADAEGMRAPRQARSQISTDRMLDAALLLLDHEGMAGVTVAAVSRLSGASNGALYHRFGDRHGLLLAAQDQFLSRLEDDWLTASAPIWSVSDPDALLAELVAVYLRIFTEHRRVFRAFLMAKDSDPGLHARGLAASRRSARFVVDRLAARFGCAPDTAAVAFQLLHGAAIMIALFEEAELPAGQVDAAARRDGLTRALAAVLRP